METKAEETDVDVPAHVIEEIARKRLGFKTLAARNADALDFREVAVWSVEEALQAAYRAGYAVGRAAPKEGT